MSSLKLAQAGLQPRLVQDVPDAAQKRNDRSSTRDTSHVLMLPYVAAAATGLAHHASRAASSAVRLAKTCGGGEQAAVSVLHEAQEPEDHAGLTDQVEAMSALLHALRESVLSKVNCRCQDGGSPMARHATEGGQGTRVSAVAMQRARGRARQGGGGASKLAYR